MDIKSARVLCYPLGWVNGGGLMRHSWIFEVLSDLRVFATANGLPRLASKAAEAEQVARDEVAQKLRDEDDEGRAD